MPFEGRFSGLVTEGESSGGRAVFLKHGDEFTEDDARCLCVLSELCASVPLCLCVLILATDHELASFNLLSVLPERFAFSCDPFFMSQA